MLPSLLHMHKLTNHNRLRVLVITIMLIEVPQLELMEQAGDKQAAVTSTQRSLTEQMQLGTSFKTENKTVRKHKWLHEPFHTLSGSLEENC